MAESRSSTYFTIAAVTVATGIIAYAAYFDYKRRNDAQFRKNLRKEKKRVEKTLAQESKENIALAALRPGNTTPEGLRAALNEIMSEDPPETADEREKYFMAQIGQGEVLGLQGPESHLQAAMSFFRALRVYPSPVELMMIYEKTVPPPVFKIVMDMTNLDVTIQTPTHNLEWRFCLPAILRPACLRIYPTLHTRVAYLGQYKSYSALNCVFSLLASSRHPVHTCSNIHFFFSRFFLCASRQFRTSQVKARVEGYYDSFPPKSSNVAVKPTGPQDTRKVLVVTQDFKAGDIIYKEFPVVSVLDADLHEARTHCANCLRRIEDDLSIELTEDSTVYPSTYCSKDCLLTSKTNSTSLLFTLDSPLPAEIASPDAITAASRELRRTAQQKFVDYLKKEGRAVPELVARFIARQVEMETTKMLAGGKKLGPRANDFMDADSGDYQLADHLERLRYLEIVPKEGESALLVDVLQNALPGLEQFISAERHAVLSGKMAYNSFGVCYGGGRDDKPEPTARPEDVEKTRTPYGTQRQVGSAFYTVSSYLTHSCEPSARPSFSSGTSELHLIAARDLKKGDELTVAYVDVTQHEGETAVECRRRRRVELARGWRFACECDRCKEEAKELTLEEQTAAGEEKKDESKVEETLKRFEEGPIQIQSEIVE
ncbi:hypothetical protein BDQ12DRAFT_595860 [Crucibulum laeve]|uniref:SET domain-containing protein n=1 Tax=Crucibulum laeve TaxID=68775 RepID=A0A5C3MGP2_9AGAR|nr:hypothetical protein BDQ12DRAFT_595860 [Crucibulum laeve]